MPDSRPPEGDERYWDYRLMALEREMRAVDNEIQGRLAKLDTAMEKLRDTLSTVQLRLSTIIAVGTVAQIILVPIFLWLLLGKK